MESRFKERETRESLRARLGIGITLLVFWLILMGMAFVTFPFVQHESTSQNVLYGLVTGLPFLALLALYLKRAARDLAAGPQEKP
jgi:hypothetical protein